MSYGIPPGETSGAPIGYVFVNRDSDGDSLIDGTERLLGTSSASLDSDCDGKPDIDEYPPFSFQTPGDDPKSGNCEAIAPVVSSASVNGSMGMITLNATASDNVGVTGVEFFVDNVSKGIDSSFPYSVPLNSTSLSNGSHSLVAKAKDAAGNVGTSSTVNFTIDNAAPTVSASVNGSRGTITLNATASDNVGVTRVDFYVDNVFKGSDSTSPYSVPIDSTTLSSGSSTTIAGGIHLLVAKAYDAAGNFGTSSTVSFIVDNIAPTVTAQVFVMRSSIQLSATATDYVGVTRVDFFVDNVFKGSGATSPYSVTLNSTTLSNGSHSLVAKAYDAAGNFGMSSTVNFTIDNTAPTVAAQITGVRAILLSATATDNVGVTMVEFFIDNVSRGIDSTSPYSVDVSYTTIADGGHILQAKAHDAAGNVGTSPDVHFTTYNCDASATNTPC